MKNLRCKKSILSIAIAAGAFLLSVSAFADEPLLNKPLKTPHSYGELYKQLLNKQESKEELPYVQNEIIVKFKEGAADPLEQQIIKEKKAPSRISLTASLERLNKKYKVKKIHQIFKGFKEEKQQLESLRLKDRIKRKYNLKEVSISKKEEKILKRLKRAP